MRLGLLVVAVVEFRDAARADQGKEFFVAPGLLWQGDGKNRFALLADLGTLGDEAQPVEIGVGTRCHGHQGLVLHAMASGIGLGSSNCQRTRWLQNRARIFENILDRRADFVGIDQDHFVDHLAADAERLLADQFDCGPVGKEANVRQTHPLAGGKRFGHGIGIVRLDADDLDLRPQPLDVCANTGYQASATDSTEHRMNRLGMLAQNLHADRPLPGNHIRIIEGVNEGELVAFFQLLGIRVGLVEGIAEEYDLAASIFHRLHFDRRGRRRHDDHCPTTNLRCRQGQPLRMIASRGADHPACQFFGRKLGQPVVSSTQLERKHRLHILAFEQQAVTDARR